MEKEKIFFIGHSHHKKTRSCDFIIEYIKNFYDIEIFYDDSWITKKDIDLHFIDDSYKSVVFWQILPTRKILKKIHSNNIIYFPMYDSFPHSDKLFWYSLRKIKIINFSKTLHDSMIKFGLNSIYMQYFPKPKIFNIGGKDKVFFWQRKNDIDINTVLPLFYDKSVSIHIHTDIDPDAIFVKASDEDVIKYNITYSKWFDSKEELENLIKTKSIYIAPRESEGIGMSFLEAMAMGKCVLANNRPTMNEYIEDGVTGYLFDKKNPSPIDFSNINKVQENAYKYIEEGYNRWINEREKIIVFLKSKNKTCGLNPFINCLPHILGVIPRIFSIILQFFLKIQFHKTKGNFIRIFNIYIYDTRKKDIL